MKCPVFFLCFIALLVIILILVHRERVVQFKTVVESFEENESIQNRKIKNQLDLFTYSRFSTDCCPSTYTSSIGCLCNDHKEHETITSRGGNRVQL